jgi:kynureninase
MQPAQGYLLSDSHELHCALKSLLHDAAAGFQMAALLMTPRAVIRAPDVLNMDIQDAASSIEDQVASITGAYADQVALLQTLTAALSKLVARDKGGKR